MHQRWSKLLFLHWKVDASELRRLIPAELTIDTFGGAAWIGVTPFTMDGVRPPFLPAVPVLSRTHELNVRTYVHAEGVPGVWFFSLDASNTLAVAAARAAFHLPYHRARMELRARGEVLEFRSQRVGAGADVRFAARWSRREALPPPPPDSLDFFLIERYCLYAADEGRLYRSRIHHRPWDLCAASLQELDSTMLSGQGLPGGGDQPLIHAQRTPLEVSVWPLQALGTRA